jgi:hypothetical protein
MLMLGGHGKTRLVPLERLHFPQLLSKRRSTYNTPRITSTSLGASIPQFIAAKTIPLVTGGPITYRPRFRWLHMAESFNVMKHNNPKSQWLEQKSVRQLEVVPLERLKRDPEVAQIWVQQARRPFP